ncbi:MAG: N-methyl-L-tryptophan oxidase [Planctomycetales bacterium]|nr:N-methyl-L-tryptophan oxidase [Planctomycetales bacterium]
MPPTVPHPTSPSRAPYDVIVLGLGGVGSAALFQLALRGARVLGIDQFAPPHARGSSHGHTRIIRQAYFEHPDYVPLVRSACQLWQKLERRTGRQLYHQVGLLEVGSPRGKLIPGVLHSAACHGLAVQQLTAADVARDYPAFTLPADTVAVFERDAGYLLVEDCVEAHLQEAVACGAHIRTHTVVRQWRADGGGVHVASEDAHWKADHLVITAGAWAGELLAQLNVPLRVLRKHLHWYATADSRYRAERGCPLFFYETAEGCFYGFPQIDSRGVKIAEHSGGELVADPGKVARDVDSGDRLRVERFLQTHLPSVSTQPTDHAVCLYTMSPDEHFLVDRHPHQPQVVFAAGLSGHGFKFAPVLGQALAEMVLDGQTGLPMEFLHAQRAGLRKGS